MTKQIRRKIRIQIDTLSNIKIIEKVHRIYIIINSSQFVALERRK